MYPNIERSAEAKKVMSNQHERVGCSEPNFQLGEPLDNPEATFCAWKLVTTYPSCYIGQANRPRAKPYFDEILHERVWDFFYLHDPRDVRKKPQLLVPTAQFEAFLNDLNDILGTSLTIPPGIPKAKFFMKFGQGGTPRPRYLKRSKNDSGLDINSWPPANFDDVTAFESASLQMQGNWTAQMKIIKSGVSPQSKPSAEKAARKKKEREQMLLATQQYLGLKTGSSPSQLDVVFVCVDVEALELPPNPISEVGIAILDTKLTKEVAPGPGGDRWLEFIETYHLRVQEYIGLVNYRFVKGCPDNFDFGTSTFPKKSELREAICSILNPYLTTSRNIVIVGHDIAQDIKYISAMGLNLLELGNVVGQVDSQDIHRIWRNDPNGRGLHTVLSDLKVYSTNLHNAGNDAYYTLHVTVKIALEATREEQIERNDEERWG
ncbi:Fc.00g110590.m01.CDS01 [Cosmosporella sp. VM-42]